MRMLEDRYRLWVLLVLLVCGLLLVWTGARASLPTLPDSYVTLWQRLPAKVVQVATVEAINQPLYWPVRLNDGRWVYATRRPARLGQPGGLAENAAAVMVADERWPCQPKVYGEVRPLAAVLYQGKVMEIRDTTLRCFG